MRKGPAELASVNDGAGTAAAEGARSAPVTAASYVPVGTQTPSVAVSPGISPAPHGGLRTRSALLTALAGGLALAAAFPPIGAWPLAAAGPALLAVALWRRRLRGSLAVGFVFGLAFFVPLLSWLVNVAWYAWAALAVAEALIFAVLTVA